MVFVQLMHKKKLCFAITGVLIFSTTPLPLVWYCLISFWHQFWEENKYLLFCFNVPVSFHWIRYLKKKRKKSEVRLWSGADSHLHYLGLVRWWTSAPSTAVLNEWTLHLACFVWLLCFCVSAFAPHPFQACN